MVIGIGSKIINALEKNSPIRLDGATLFNKKLQKFQYNNPNVLEALPDEFITQEILEGMKALNNKDLSKVEKFLNNCGYDKKVLTKAFSKLKNIFHKESKEFNQEQLNNLMKKSFPNIKIPTNVNTDAMVYLSKLSKDIGSKFDAHGMGKISITQQLKDLNSILTKGIDNSKTFCTAPLVAKDTNIGAALGTAGGSAYRDGSFILVGEKGKLLKDSGIKHVVVNDAFYPIVDDLQKQFPDVNFVKAESVKSYFEKL